MVPFFHFALYVASYLSFKKIDCDELKLDSVSMVGICHQRFAALFVSRGQLGFLKSNSLSISLVMLKSATDTDTATVLQATQKR